MILRVHGDTLAAPGLLDYATCLWPGPLPAPVRLALEQGLADHARYPDDRRARAAIADRHGRPPDEVLLLNGACEAFWLLAHALRPARAACVHPSFTEPEAALRCVGAAVTRVSLDDDGEGWSLDVARVPEAVELVVVGNPNNPTGTLAPASILARLARPGRHLVVDESFAEFVDGERESLAGRRDLPGLVVVRSLTKLHGLAGVRAGYLLAAPALVERLAGHRQPWSVNALACAALAACALDAQTPRRVAREVAAARTELLDALTRRPDIQAWPAAANFLLLRLADAGEVVAGLRARGIAVRPAGSFPGLGDDHVRIAVRPAEDNARLLAALDEVLPA